uniref:Uncharacterized protein n=1 Tax=Takifugu rubripes TaxID=31033 RepID=A0A674P013_TAKRU
VMQDVSHTLLSCGVSHKFPSVCLHAPFVVYCCMWHCCGMKMFLFWRVSHALFSKQVVSAKISLGCFNFLVIRLFCRLIQVVSAFRKVSLCTVLFLGGCGSLLITDASHLHPHKVRKIPSAGNQSSPAAVRDAFGHTFSLHPLQNYKMASAASHNNIDLSLRCQVTHASGVAALGCGRSKSPRLLALASVDVRLPH